MPQARSSQILAAFDKVLQEQRDRELAKAANFIEEAADQLASIRELADANELPKVSPRREPLKTPEQVAANYAEATTELAEATAEFVDGEDGLAGKRGTMKLYRAVCLQGDHIDRKRRAESLLYSSRARRKIHSASRRYAHGMVGGLLDRVYKGEILGLLR